MLAASEEPYVVKDVATFTGENVTLKSASGDPNSAVVAFAVQPGGVFGALKATNGELNFEGVTLKYDKGGSNFNECIMFDFYDKAHVSFKNCVLDGAGLDRSTGVFVKDVGSTLNLSGVTLRGFKVGLQTTRSAKTTADGTCVFGPSNGQALVVEDSGEVDVTGATFVQNETACYVGNQGKGSVSSSTFNGNGKSIDFGSFAGRSFKHEDNVGE